MGLGSSPFHEITGHFQFDSLGCVWITDSWRKKKTQVINSRCFPLPFLFPNKPLHKYLIDTSYFRQIKKWISDYPQNNHHWSLIIGARSTTNPRFPLSPCMYHQHRDNSNSSYASRRNRHRRPDSKPQRISSPWTTLLVIWSRVNWFPSSSNIS